MDKRKQQKKQAARPGKGGSAKAKPKSGELSDKQLEAIAGGLARKRSRK